MRTPFAPLSETTLFSTRLSFDSITIPDLLNETMFRPSIVLPLAATPRTNPLPKRPEPKISIADVPSMITGFVSAGSALVRVIVQTFVTSSYPESLVGMLKSI